MKSKTNPRGGRRAGAGRKPLGRVKTLVTLTPEANEALRNRAKAEDLSLGEVIEKLLTSERKSV